MPLYTPKFRETDFKGGINILASVNFDYIEGGATLDPTKFEVGYNAIGKAIGRNPNTGLWEDLKDAGDLSTFDDFGILDYDFYNDGESTLVAGQVLIAGAVYEAKLADEVADEVKAKMPMVRFVNDPLNPKVNGGA